MVSLVGWSFPAGAVDKGTEVLLILLYKLKGYPQLISRSQWYSQLFVHVKNANIAHKWYRSILYFKLSVYVKARNKGIKKANDEIKSFVWFVRVGSMVSSWDGLNHYARQQGRRVHEIRHIKEAGGTSLILHLAYRQWPPNPPSILGSFLQCFTIMDPPSGSAPIKTVPDDKSVFTS